MCNAWNHPPDCDCGFGGGTRIGTGWPLPSVSRVQSWPYRDDDFCRPTACPVCGASVFFVRHNGGSVWFDELGPPWPKHGCFDDEPPAQRLRGTLTTGPESIFGVVIETELSTPPRIVIRCSDGSIIDRNVATPWILSSLVGQLVVVKRHADGRLTLRRV